MKWAMGFWFRDSVNAGAAKSPSHLIGLGGAQQSLEPVASELGVRPLDSFIYVSAEDVEDMLRDDGELPSAEIEAALDSIRGQPEAWFSSADGLITVRALIDHLANHPTDVEHRYCCSTFDRQAALADLRLVEVWLAAAATADVPFQITTNLG